MATRRRPVKAQRGEQREGVFIPRRDTASAFNHWVGGKLFPGLFQRSTFQVDETAERYRIAISRPGLDPHVLFEGEEANELAKDSCFSSLSEASDFFAQGAGRTWAMVIEYIRYEVTDGDALVRAYQEASRALDASPHCLSYELSRCTEEPSWGRSCSLA